MAVIAAVLAPRPLTAADNGTGTTWLVRRASPCRPGRRMVVVVVVVAAGRIGQTCVQQGSTAAAVAFFVDEDDHFCQTVFGPRGVLFGVS